MVKKIDDKMKTFTRELESMYAKESNGNYSGVDRIWQLISLKNS